MPVGLIGKHPGAGDFLRAGLPAGVADAVSGWLDTAMADARLQAGPRFPALWDAMVPVRFWLGERLLGFAVAGVLAASRDSVGRRAPLAVVCAAPDPVQVPPPPVLAPGPGWHEAAETVLAALAAGALPEPVELGTRLAVLAPEPPADAAPPGGEVLWAVRRAGAGGRGPVEVLLADAAAADHRRAAAGRGYLWAAPAAGLPARLLALPGLPDGTAFGWFLDPPGEIRAPG